MTTVFSIGVLVIVGFVANFIWVFVGNVAGLPGALVGGLSSSRSLWRFRAGIMAAFLGQAYVGLAFAAWVASWTRLAAARPDVLGLLLWPVAFLVVACPMWVGLIRARGESREQAQANAQVEALRFSTLAIILGFLVFALVPVAAAALWGWVPFVTAAART